MIAVTQQNKPLRIYFNLGHSGRKQAGTGERELTTGLLAKEASFRLIVSGKIGVKEIERLIQKLEIDKEILADMNDGPSDDDIADADQRDRSGQAK